MSVARDLAKYALGLKLSDLPREVVHEAKRALLDTVGCAFGGYPSQASQIMQGVIKDIGGTPEATVIGSGLRTSCLNAALANGIMVRYLDYNDTYIAAVGSMVSGGHPSELIPAALAISERGHYSGKELIPAMVLGYELSARFTDCVINIPMENRGWCTELRGAYVMPLVVGKLLGLNEDQMENAMGISGSHDMVLGILDAPGEPYTMTKNARFPFTAHSGIMGALLAQRGFTGPARVIEGNRGFVQAVMNGEFDLKRLVQGDGKFKILDTNYKLITADYTTHGHLSATLSLVRQHNIKPEDVAQVKLTAGTRDVEHTGDRAKRYPTNKESADHSSYWLTAIAITYRVVGPDQFTEKSYYDPKIKELIDKVSMEADLAMDPFVAAGRSEITTRQGAKYSCRVDYPRGHHRNPVPDSELEEKYRAMASKYMADKQMKQIVDIIHDLENLDDVGKLMKALVSPR